MTSWLSFLNEFGVPIVFVAQLALSVFILFLKDKFAPKSLEKNVGDLEEKVSIIEVKMENIPSAEDLHSLEKQICELRGDLKAVDEKFGGTDGLLKRLERQVNRMDQFWRNK